MKRFLAGIFTLSKYSQYFYRHQCSLNAKLDNCSNFKFNFRKKRNQKYSTTPCHHPRPAAPIFLARLFVSRFFSRLYLEPAKPTTVQQKNKYIFYFETFKHWCFGVLCLLSMGAISLRNKQRPMPNVLCQCFILVERMKTILANT